ncbi:MAG: hypothetical protein K2N44_18950 [Lachnospiraceae bacterium]|nr:hypothetical protein [Lachnospiraceae bacterium]
MKKVFSLFYAHGHPEEVCQLELTGARRASRGEGHSLLDSFTELVFENWKKYLDFYDKDQSSLVFYRKIYYS